MFPYLGELLALACALTWAVSVILFKRSEQVSPQGLNLFKNVLTVGLLVPTMWLFNQGIDWSRASEDWWRLGLSGVLGIAVADTLFFVALRRLGPGRLAVVDCFYAPVTAALAIQFLGERPGAGFAIGVGLVAVGLLLVATEGAALKIGPPVTEPSSWPGVLAGILAVTTLAVGVVIAKPALERGMLVEVTLVRLLGGIAAQLVWLAVNGDVRRVVAELRPGPVWRTLLPASFLGSYVSMLLWLGGFKWATASAAAVLNQMTVVFTIILGRVILGEELTRRRVLGSVAAVGGALFVLLY